MNNQDERLWTPRWVLEVALDDHRHQCSYCGSGRQDLCRDEDFTSTIENLLARGYVPKELPSLGERR